MATKTKIKINSNQSNQCKDCFYWNRYDLTYIRKEMDCCAYWHMAYIPEQNYGNRIKDCFVSKNYQLSLF